MLNPVDYQSGSFPFKKKKRDKFVRFEMLLPLAMVLLQVGWGHYLEIEDLLIEDCMKLKKEPKMVKSNNYINVDTI